MENLLPHFFRICYPVFFLLLPAGIYAQWMTTTLSQSRMGLAGASAGDVVLFAGGSAGNETDNATGRVDIYDGDNQTWTIDRLSVNRAFPTAVSTGESIFFAGGQERREAHTLTNTSDKVDIYFPKSNVWQETKLSQARTFLSGARAGDKVLFAGGIISFENYYQVTDLVDIYDLRSGRWSQAKLSVPRAFIAAASVGKLAVFAGGYTGPGKMSDVVDIYDASTNTWRTAALSEARGLAAAAAVGKKLLIAGGVLPGSSNVTRQVDIYDVENDRWSQASLSQGRGAIQAAVIGERVFFVGGGSINTSSLIEIDASSAIDIYDDHTQSWSTDQLQTARIHHAVAAAGKHLIVAGGTNPDRLEISEVEIFTDNTVTTAVNRTVYSGDDISVFPIPAQDQLFIRLPDHFTTKRYPKAIALMDSRGRTVRRLPLTGDQISINLERLPFGLYFVTIYTEKGVIIRKVVVE